jgi:hypothetical protein
MLVGIIVEENVYHTVHHAIYFNGLFLLLYNKNDGDLKLYNSSLHLNFKRNCHSFHIILHFIKIIITHISIVGWINSPINLIISVSLPYVLRTMASQLTQLLMRQSSRASFYVRLCIDSYFDYFSIYTLIQGETLF